MGRIVKYNRDKHLKKKYGISIKQYNKLLKQQKKCCAICGKHQKNEKRNFAVDHNHKTKFIRGILCTYCNSRLLKYLYDAKKRAIGLIKYLQNAVDNDKDWKVS
uniref:Putative recombination endonuclease VII n=1 Tax=viral metagenome TaxID=1070528 RepID=A0A6H1ZY46_9ZZZZ